MHENRETSSAPVEQTGRSEKALCRTADMYALEESDRCVVPMKQLNKEGQPSAEAVEGRRRPKENFALSSVPTLKFAHKIAQLMPKSHPLSWSRQRASVSDS